MRHELARRRALLTAALGLMRLRWRGPAPPAVLMLARWLNSWPGLGAVVFGMNAQGFNVELKEFPDGWRANFYPVGIAHSVVTGSAREPTAAAVRRPATDGLSPVRARDVPHRQEARITTDATGSALVSTSKYSPTYSFACRVASS